MNERGIPVDTRLAKKTIRFLRQYNRGRIKKCVKITGHRPTQRDRILEWIQERAPDIKSLQRAELERALKIHEHELDTKLNEVIQIRLEQGRVSTKKLKSMIDLECEDGTVKGSFVYHGAGTGRFTAKRLQPHNFQRPTLKQHEIDKVFECLENNPWDIVKLFPGRVLEAVGSAMRGFIRAPDGYELAVADYNAIEARVLAWLAGQEDMVLAFHEGKDVYVGMGAYIFGDDEEQLLADYKAGILEADVKRKLGKDSTLGCGYSMSIATFLHQMESKGTDDIAGIPIRLDPNMRGRRDKESFNPAAWDMAANAVYGYRRRYVRIERLWKVFDTVVKDVISGRKKRVRVYKKIRFYMDGKALVMELPSGRRIFYPDAHLSRRKNRWTGKEEDAIVFRTVTDKGTWVWETSYGAKFVENAVQAISRDLMVYGMRNASKLGLFELIGTVHDEIISIMKKVYARNRMLKKYITALCEMPPWAIGDDLAHTIPLKAEGYIAKRYRK
jgi:DNA polymerase